MLTPPLAAGSLPLLGHALQMRRDPLRVLDSLRGQGDLVQIKLGAQRICVVNSAALTREILVVRPRDFDNGPQIAAARELLGNGLVSSEGETHRRQRLLMQPAFRRDKIAEYARIMRDQIVEKLATWHDGRIVDMRSEMSALTLGVTAKSMLSSSLGQELQHEIQTGVPFLLDTMHRRMINPVKVLAKLPTSRNREYSARLARLHCLIDQVLLDYRAKGEDQGDLLSMLLVASDPDTGETLSDTEIHDQVTTILAAGTETTASALCWMFLLLAEHPAAEAHIHGEVDRVLGGRPSDYRDLHALPYTRQVVRESLRLYGPAWVISRRANKDLSLNGCRIDAGTSMLLSPYLVSRDPRLYPDPETFDPGRWSRERSPDIPREAITYFGGGHRRCIGEMFAEVEATLALSSITAQWRLRMAPEATLVRAARFTLYPAGLLMEAVKR